MYIRVLYVHISFIFCLKNKQGERENPSSLSVWIIHPLSQGSRCPWSENCFLRTDVLGNSVSCSLLVDQNLILLGLLVSLLQLSLEWKWGGTSSSLEKSLERCLFPWAAVTMGHTTAYHNRNTLPHSSGGCESEGKVSAGHTPVESSGEEPFPVLFSFWRHPVVLG